MLHVRANQQRRSRFTEAATVDVTDVCSALKQCSVDLCNELVYIIELFDQGFNWRDVHECLQWPVVVDCGLWIR